MRPIAHVSAIFLVIIVLSECVRGDVFLKYRRILEGYEVKGKPVAPETTYTTIWFGGERVRCDDGEVTIADFRTRTVYRLYSFDHSYTRMPLDSAGAYMWKRLGALDDTPTARAARATAELVLREGRTTAAVRFRRETKAIRGLPCKRYSVTRSGPDGAWSGDVWVSERIVADAARLWVVRCLALLGIHGFSDMVAELAKMRGVPVLEIVTAHVAGCHVISTEQLMEYGEKPAPVGAYEIPDGWVEKPWTPRLSGGGGR